MKSAIRTYVLAATDTQGARMRAKYMDFSDQITIPFDFSASNDENHSKVFRAFKEKYQLEDMYIPGSAKTGMIWVAQ